ncbi:uncharacterized protein LOC109853327 [Pseudomyrmex gracilis]|uniref:uncharacterized protein LOC109853327 n=1 Tax=Pseudomyrmex gracilis TaxID=219809 RepID=UPI000994A50C|nr:uncharacterized protein LOC109853327 [Pseudomyrmex gracilis]
MDLYGKDKGNVSLPKRLQPPDFDETKLENVIINTQTRFYDLKIAETIKRIQRLEERNTELEDTLKHTNRYIKTLEEEKAQEISTLNSQLSSYLARIEECKEQMGALEKSMIDNNFAHTVKLGNIDEKYKNTRLVLISQLKFLNAKINVLEDYKSKQYILEKKLDTQNQSLVHEKEQMATILHQIEWKFTIDRKKYKYVNPWFFFHITKKNIDIHFYI